MNRRAWVQRWASDSQGKTRALRALRCVVPAVCLIAACNGAQEPEPASKSEPRSVTCAAARRGAIADQVELHGVIHPPPDREVVVSPRAAGALLEVRVHEGDRVTKGQVLAVVDVAALLAASSEAHAVSVSAQAADDNARAALARAQRLFAQGIAAKREVDDAQATAASAEAQLSAARARQTLASTERDRARVTAPLSGVVMRVYRAVGDLVDGSSQTPLADIADATQLELRVDAPAAALVRVQQGAPATIHIDALPDAVLHGHAILVAPAVDPQTGLGSVRIAIDPSELPLKVGLAGRADVEGARRDTVTLVPSAALRRSSSGQDEVVVCMPKQGAAGVADVRVLQLGARHQDEVEVRDGLEPGERVVVDHALNLETGTALAIEPAASSDAHEHRAALLAPEAAAR